MKLIAMLFLASMVLQASSQMDGAVTLCGRRLSNARAVLCYVLGEMEKRGGSYEDLSPAESSEQNGLDDWPWGGRRAALGARWARHKRGLVDECCLKPCTMDEILSYC
ncbi:Bombyxin C-1 [Eumeta japonica]|uniref:Bombyxin C-1 n=1 Tax=Eumeta variegata TaxID=151549 RepID=A0A4C1Z431_EUMVA|nr:Bombyxin C-1 [Eumeta japonica]